MHTKLSLIHSSGILRFLDLLISGMVTFSGPRRSLFRGRWGASGTGSPGLLDLFFGVEYFMVVFRRFLVMRTGVHDWMTSGDCEMRHLYFILL